ncbi:MAG: hypothetical protein WCK86_21100 [Planctomycetia bacterium]
MLSTIDNRWLIHLDGGALSKLEIEVHRLETGVHRHSRAGGNPDHGTVIPAHAGMTYPKN